MIQSERFCWAHFGRTGGDAVWQWVTSHYPHLIQRADAPTDPAKHSTFAERPEWSHGRLKVMNIRRLPAWYLSFAAHHVISTGPWSMKSLGLVRDFLRENVTTPDRELARYGHVDVWLRMEYLADDVTRFLSQYTTPQSLTAKTKQRLPYNHDINAWLSAHDIADLYRHNPIWAAIECSCYAALSSPWRNEAHNLTHSATTRSMNS